MIKETLNINNNPIDISIMCDKGAIVNVVVTDTVALSNNLLEVINKYLQDTELRSSDLKHRLELCRMKWEMATNGFVQDLEEALFKKLEEILDNL